MSDLITLKKVALGPQHLRPGRARHRRNDGNGNLRDFPPFVCLEIAMTASRDAYYLFHIAENNEIADTWHQTLDEAFEQAEFEFGVERNEWVDIEPSTR
jgi:hypothetical protein